MRALRALTVVTGFLALLAFAPLVHAQGDAGLDAVAISDVNVAEAEGRGVSVSFSLTSQVSQQGIGYGIGLYALLSNDALGGWDMFWEGGKNGVLDINGIINKAKGQPGVNPEVIQNKEMILKGKDRVAGLKILFNDPQKLKLYLKNDQGKWS